MKDSIKTRQRFFLVGCSRSGTSVLQSRLANHSQVFSLPETEFLRALFGRDLWYWFGLLGIIRGRSARRAHEKLTQALEFGHGLPPSTGRFGCAREQMRRFISLLDELADQERKLHWLEKSPKHFRYLSHIDKYVPDARVIHIVRDGRAVAASLRNRALQFPDEFGRQMDPRYGVRLWNQSVRTALGR